MGNDWKIQETDRATLEAAIGGAVLDKLRNHKTNLVDLYVARGGQDPKSRRVLESYETRLNNADYSRLPQLLAAEHGGDLDRAFSNWNLSQIEMARLERAIGAARIAATEGTGGSVLDHYTRLGGSNPQTQQALGQLTQRSAARGSA